MSDRTVDELLADLRGRLEAADRARRSRPGRAWRRRRGLALVVVATLVLGSTATATRSVWAPSAPGDRAPGGEVVQVAAGGSARGGWTLAAQRCEDGSVATFLRVAAAGAGRGCGGRPAPVGSYYDPAGQRTYVFALVPASAHDVQLGLRGTPDGSSVPTVARIAVRPSAADPLALQRARLAPTAVAVGSREGAWTVATMAVLDRAGRVVARCEEARCAGAP
jgi:hypothetical protein